MFFFREKPPTAPSSTHAIVSGTLKDEIVTCFKEPALVRLVIVFGLILGLMNTYGTIMGIMATQLEYTAANSSTFGAVFIVGGLVGSGVFGGIVEVKKNYKVVTCVISVLTALLPIPLLFSLFSMNVVAVNISSFAVGFASISILPVGIDFGVELTHPVAESVSSGLLMSAGNFLGIFMTLASSYLITALGNKGCGISQIILIGVAWLAAVVSFTIKEDLKRLKESR